MRSGDQGIIKILKTNIFFSCFLARDVQEIEMGNGFEYEYHHELRMDKKIMARYAPPEFRDWNDCKYYFFEFRIKFIVEDEQGTTIVLGLERFHACSSIKVGGGSETRLLAFGIFKLGENWMTPQEMQSMFDSAMDFARKMETDHPSLGVIPVVLEIVVCTEQQAGEPIAATFKRALRPDPIRLLNMFVLGSPKPVEPGLVSYLSGLSRIRVECVEQGLGLMDVCGICLRSPTVGDQISHLKCGHAFHSYCAVKWLMGSKLCPSCNARLHNFVTPKINAAAAAEEEEFKLVWL